jgi:hypothetical protein
VGARWADTKLEASREEACGCGRAVGRVGAVSVRVGCGLGANGEIFTGPPGEDAMFRRRERDLPSVI